MTKTYQLGWFSTGRDKAARDLLKTVQTSIKQAEIKAQIAFVFCTRERGESEQGDLFLKLVEDYGIPLVCFSFHCLNTVHPCPQYCFTFVCIKTCLMKHNRMTVGL